MFQTLSSLYLKIAVLLFILLSIYSTPCNKCENILFQRHVSMAFLTSSPFSRCPEPTKELPLKRVEDKPATTYKSSLCVTVNPTSPLLAMVSPSTSPLSPGPASYWQPIGQQPTRKMSGESGEALMAANRQWSLCAISGFWPLMCVNNK